MWKFNPIYKPTIWGGEKIAAMRGFVSDRKLGECWLLSGIPGSESTIADGPLKGRSITELVASDAPAILGKLNAQKFGDGFPLLIKIIDAGDKLSVQVHPDDSMAAQLGKPRGKTEMWYVMNCDRDASLTLGFNRDIDADELDSLVAEGEIESVLNHTEVKEGDVFFIPAGTIHSIGRGSLLIEVQQSSDDTYRIYDYRRVDNNGTPRELHLDMARRALNMKQSSGKPVDYNPIADIPVNVVKSPYFTANVMRLDEPMLRDYSECDSFVAIIASRGKARLSSRNDEMDILPGELVLIPASTDNINIEPFEEFTAMEVYIKQ